MIGFGGSKGAGNEEGPSGSLWAQERVQGDCCLNPSSGSRNHITTGELTEAETEAGPG